MKRFFPYFLLSMLLIGSFGAKAQVIINEIAAPGTVELKNIGNTMIPVGDYWLCDFPAYERINDLNVICGNVNLAPGEILVVDNFNFVSTDDGEMGLYSTNSFGSAAAMQSYVEWGSAGHQRSTVAIAAGVWTAGNFVPAFNPEEFLSFDGAGNMASDWSVEATSTLCEENGGNGACDADGGDLNGGPFEFTAGDGQDDMIPAGSIALTNNQGENSQWIVTDANGIILGLPPMPSVVNFEGAGPGNCLVWHLSYDGEITGLEMGADAADLEGCFDLSNSVQVIRTAEGDCQANGGTLFGGPFEFTAGDGQDDMIPAGSITVANSQGENFQWIVTDANGIILGLPPMPSVVNFEGAGPGNCLVWYARFDGEVQGLEAGANANDITGCFSLSNPVEIIRTAEGDCQANGGTLFGGPFEFTAGDGQDDMIPAGSITV
ncbi:MAG: hypothetical protein AAF985_20215, partial [Bacteroidota bacterium]